MERGHSDVHDVDIRVSNDLSGRPDGWRPEVSNGAFDSFWRKVPHGSKIKPCVPAKHLNEATTNRSQPDDPNTNPLIAHGVIDRPSLPSEPNP